MRPSVRRIVQSVAAGALCLPLALTAAGADRRDAAVGAEGRLYRILEGSYGDLFPEEGLGAPENPVLALEIVDPEQQPERFLVPETQGEDLEDSASVLFEDDSATLFILWQTKINTIHSRLNLIGFRDGRWTESIEISGNPFGWKSSPQLAVTRDSFLSTGEHGGSRTWQRTVVHLIWWEDGSSGPQVLYTPVVLIDGQYTGWNRVYPLDTLVGASGSFWATPNPALARAPRLEPGVNGQSVVIGFVPAAGGQLVTVALELLPSEISALADEVRHQIIDVGREVRDEGGPAALAGKVRHQIIDVGARLGFHPAVSTYVATQVHDRLAASDPQRPVETIAEDVRHQIIDVGAQVTDRRFDRLARANGYEVIELPEGGRTGETGVAAPSDLIRVIRTSVRAVPQTGEQANAVYLSADGRDVVVAWQEGDGLLFRESRPDGWSGIRRLRLNPELDLQRAHALLERRADERGPSRSE